MSKRITICILILFSLLLWTTPALAAKAYSADRFDVDIAVQRDGSANITETVTFRYEGGPFTYAFRSLPTHSTGGISNVQVSEQGRAYTGGRAPGQFELTVNNRSLDVKWYFEPTSDAARTFTLQYRVADVMRLDEGQANLRWGAVPPDHDYAIAASQVTVRLPAGVRAARADVLGGSAGIDDRGEIVVFNASDIRRDRQVTVAVWAPSDAFSNVPPAWQTEEIAREARQRAAIPALALASGLILVVGLVGLVVWRRRVPAYPPLPRNVPAYTAPDSLPPALAAALAKDSNGAALGTLLDLARRGVVQIIEQPRQVWYGRKVDFDIILRRPDAPLLPFEQAIVTAAFTRAKRPGVVNAEELAGGLQKGRSAINTAIKTALSEQDFLHPARQRTRDGMFIVAFLLMALALAAAVLFILLYGVFGALIPIALGVLAVAAAILGATVSPRSAEGERRAIAWRAFYDYLGRVADGKAPDAAQLLDPYLPYAAAFGLEQKWVKRYSEAGVPVPAWFQAASNRASADGSMASFIVVMSAASHSSGASSAAGAGAAAGGAAGGGASGSG